MCPQTASLVITPFDCTVTSSSTETGQEKTSVLQLQALFDLMRPKCEQMSPLLPSNCRQYVSRLKSKLVVLEFAPTIVDASYLGPDILDYERASAIKHPDIKEIKYGNNTVPFATFRVPTPWMIYVSLLGFEDGLHFIRQDYLMAATGPLSVDSDILYQCPFGNVHSGDHTICWGDFTSSHNSFRNLDFLERLLFPRFFGSPFNKDLDNSLKWNATYAKDNFGHNGGASSYELLKVINGMDTFPVELLTKSNKSYAGFINNITNRFLS